jgi:hypothetical protein
MGRCKYHRLWILTRVYETLALLSLTTTGIYSDLEYLRSVHIANARIILGLGEVELDKNLTG